MSNDNDPTAPSSLRWTKNGNNAVKSLMASTNKTRSVIMMEAVIEKHDRTVAVAPIAFRLLSPSEILTLQAEIASLEKLHSDNRRNVKIRTSDKHATEKMIKAVEKIDAEVKELRRFRLKLGKMAQLPEALSPEDLESVNALADGLERTAIASSEMAEHIEQLQEQLEKAAGSNAGTEANIGQLRTKLEKATIKGAEMEELVGKIQTELDQTRNELASASQKAIAEIEEGRNLRHTLTALVEIADSFKDDETAAKVKELIEVLEIRTKPKQENKVTPEKMLVYEFELKTLKTLLALALQRK